MYAEGFDVVFAGTRAQAIENGELVDVTYVAPELTQNAGFTVPLAMTATSWAEYVDVPDGVIGQDWKARLWDMVWALSSAIRAAKQKGHLQNTLQFGVFVRNDNRRPRLVRLRAVCTTGDDGRACITILKRGEN